MKRVLCDYQRILLNGHFCIAGIDNKIEAINYDVFKQLDLDLIIYLCADLSRILRNLNVRDKKAYDESMISDMISIERYNAISISEKLKVPLIIHDLNYTEVDNEDILRKMNIGELL